MTKDQQRIESLEEMVFKNRNKAYGAYYLRKKYKNYMIISLITAIFIMAVVVAYPIVTAVVNKGRILNEEKTVGVEMLDIPQEEAPPPPPPPPPPEALEQQVKFTAPVVVEDTNIDQGLATQDELSTKVSSEVPDEDQTFEIVEEKPQVIEQPKEAEIFTVVEENPQFPGGDAELYRYLAENIKYPEEAKELVIQGRVFVNFVVEPDGSISNVRVLRGIGGGCDEEAIRVVKSMPKWTPGKQRGQPVRVSFNLPVKFTLQ